MERYNVTGMTCAACSSRVEKAVSAIDGVTSCSVNLLTNSMSVEGNASHESVFDAVKCAGYSASLFGSDKPENEDALRDTETPKLVKLLLSSIAFLLPLMYFSMGHTMLGLPIPKLLEENYIALGLIQLLCSLTVMIINQRFFISGAKAILNRSPNMDTLVSLGSFASFGYSVYAVFAMTNSQLSGNLESVMSYYHELYFESAAMILVLITVGKMLEARSKGKTTDALKSLMNLAPKTAILLKDGVEVSVDIAEVKQGDIFILRPGQSIPVDGVVIEGLSAVDESTLTGESIPIDKNKGDNVFSGTLNKSGFLKCEASRVGEDTTLSQIIKTVTDAASTKAPVAKIADKVSGVFVPIVCLISLLTLFVWLLLGYGVGFSVARAISVLVISCPCALGLATPVAIMVGSGIGAKNGILFKTAASLEAAGNVNTVVLDKTGTITLGEPKVTDIIPNSEVSADELLKLAFSLELMSEHPLAKAIVLKGREMNLTEFKVDSFCSHPGSGVSGKIDEIEIVGGNLSFAQKFSKISDSDKATVAKLSEEGKTPLLFLKDKKSVGIIAVADIIKSEAERSVKELENMGIDVVMLTGDNEKTARSIAAQVGIDNVISGVMPNGKENEIKKLKKTGKVIMVGDGINDAPALTRADIGIAIGAGADIAIDSADVVLMKSNLSDVPAAIRLSRATLKNIKQNLFWAFVYNLIGIPLAAGAWYPIFGWLLNPMFGAAAMSLSSICVVTNALRLNLFNIYSTKHDIKRKRKTKKEVKSMEKTVKIEGMMCPHCEVRVKSIFEAMPQVDDALVSHESGTAVLTLNSELSDADIKSAIEAQGYKVI